MKLAKVLPGMPEDRADWIIFPAGVHRDSDALARSNYKTALGLLRDADPCGDDWEERRFGHWAVGWIDEIIVRPDSVCAKIASDCAARLDDYPALDEDDLAQEEYEEACETWKTCYSDRERLTYIRRRWWQFESCRAKWSGPLDAWRILLANVRGERFDGYASDLISR